MSELSKTKVGISRFCVVCGRMKKPVGRDAAWGMTYCTHDCDGYDKAPLPGSLWPGESEYDFGYAVGERGLETKP